ncbi:MAG: GAF domain-containing protein [candidate division Zixibacteria bacterium]|nr:GAF domain-containing protein [candidate division Zixibacteria bacterium]MDH3938478.1 GAF domain-containing protein [candidate division Zixibacteria bacterium]MDH4032424.1 GAF domain-containing protein [candidate division Zixibacteria bacterium]
MSVYVLGGAWFTAVGLNLALHRSFAKGIERWAAKAGSEDLPPRFDLYFTLDFGVLYVTVLVGAIMGLGFSHLTILLVLNLVIYGAYVGRNRNYAVLLFAGLLGLLIIGQFVAPQLGVDPHHPTGVFLFLGAGPILGTLAVTVFTVTIISSLRSAAEEVVKARLRILQRCKDHFRQESSTIPDYGSLAVSDESVQSRFDEAVSKSLEDLCTSEEALWYGSACLWYEVVHQDKGRLLIMGPQYGRQAEQADTSRVISDGSVMATRKCLFYRSLKKAVQKQEEVWDLFADALDAPAVIVPIMVGQRRVALLVLTGREKGPPIITQEELFVNVLGDVFADALSQVLGRAKAEAIRELDDLFRLKEFAQVFPSAADVLKKHLDAEGCMIIYRDPPDKDLFALEASPGFSKKIELEDDHIIFRTGSMTDLVANGGETMRIDDVRLHEQEFNGPMLQILEKALGSPIESWMGIPIGSKSENYGVIKVVNRRLKGSWFTDADQELGERLALRLVQIIRWQLQMQKSEANRLEAVRHADAAEQALQVAEAMADDREKQLLTLTHQIVGPLTSMSGAVSVVLDVHLTPFLQVRLRRLHDLIEDALCLSVGTFSTFAVEAEQDVRLVNEPINAPEEMRRLAERLQSTQARPDLSFHSITAQGFPTVHLPRMVFTSVLYSLIHNTMKYADEDSRVDIECGYERKTGEAVLKVRSVGEPIQPHEVERIFVKFGRGYYVGLGRHHGGAGLGLWVARELIKAVGGDLGVELSEKHERLSTFIVRLPTQGSLDRV